jgi:tetratricopeptide (TPR) repeat protein
MKRLPALPEILAIAALALAAAPAAGAPDPAALTAAKRALQAAVNHADVPALLEAHGQFEALAAGDSGASALHAWLAVADWRVVPLLSAREKSRDQAKHFALEGLAECDRALALEPGFTEILALKAGLQGLLIGLEPGSMMTLGLQSMQNLKQAAAQAPENPRVWLLSGINTLHKPAAFGGGAASAVPELQKAELLFANSPAGDSAGYNWGREDASFWLGQAHTELKQYAEAREDYRRALALNSEFGWARAMLAEAEKAMKEKS